MNTATGFRLKIDQDTMARKRSVDLLLHLLHDFIPHCAFRDAETRLHETFKTNGIELTSATMRKEYEAWKSLQLDAALTTANPVCIVRP